MQRLTIIVASPDPIRFHAALSLAAANAALNRPTRLFLQAEAVGLLRSPITAPGDERYAAAGLPTLADLVRESVALGVSIIACQSGLSLSAMSAADLPPEVETGGLIDLLRTESRVVLA